MKGKRYIQACAAAACALFCVSCDLFNPGRYNDAVDAYNAVDNPGYSNYWRRLFYTGPDLNAGDIDEQSLVVIDGTAYVFGQTYDDTEEGAGTMATHFGKVDLETLMAEELSEMPLSEFAITVARTTVEMPIRAGDDIFCFIEYYNETSYVTSYILYRYDTGIGEWARMTEGIDTTTIYEHDLFECGGRYFLFFLGRSDVDVSIPYLYEYAGDTFATVTLPSADLTNCVRNDDSFVLYADDLGTCARFDFDTDSLESMTLTNNLEDTSTGYIASYFLSGSGRFYALRWDSQSASADAADFDPVYIDHVDLDSELTWYRDGWATHPRIGGSEVSAVCFGDDLYLLPSTYWYEGTEMPISPATLYRVNYADLSIENLGELPLAAEDVNYSELWLAEANGMLFFNIEVGLLSFEVPKPFMYDPSAADGDEWTALGYGWNYLGVRWSHVPDIDYGWYNGKYYRGGVDGGPEVIPNCLFVYTP